ncbi:methyltransferase domain-containing protein [bacterium]|nr:methyltransferase domain-containing protein [candidate division CSSED10-310 bacterium]
MQMNHHNEMNDPKNLADKIRAKIRELHKTEPGKILDLSSPVPPTKKELNPDTDPEAFSKVRLKYEQQLKKINSDFKTDITFSDDDDLIASLTQLNEMAQSPLKIPSSKRFLGILRKFVQRIVRFGFSGHFTRQEELISFIIQAVNQLNHKIRLFASEQCRFNSNLAEYALSIVPVMDEKTRYAYDTMNEILKENMMLMVKRMDNLFEGLDRRQTEVITWLENTSKDFQNVMNQFEILKKETTRSLLLQHQKLEKANLGAAARFDMDKQFSDTDEDIIGEYAYYQFEQEHRGSEDTIRKNQKRYLKIFRNHSPVLDIGCGRGEMLELLKAEGIPAKGIDSNHDMIGICLQKALDAERNDALVFLKDTKKETWGAIFSAQVIEHLPRRVVQKYFELAFDALKPGGLLCIETVNTASPFALMNHYYRDPTHQPPVHPDTYKFLAETVGFIEVDIEYLSSPEGIVELSSYNDHSSDSAEKKFNQLVDAITQIQTFLYAPSDIMMIAHKPSDTES